MIKTLVFVALLLMTYLVVSASERFGIYAIVDKVQFEPSESAPQRLRIHGVFIVPLPQTSGDHKAAQRGSLYFEMVKGREDVIKKEWADLKSVAGTGQGIAFAQYWITEAVGPNSFRGHALPVTVHKDGEPATPAAYPLGMGVVKLVDAPGQGNFLSQLRAAHRER